MQVSCNTSRLGTTIDVCIVSSTIFMRLSPFGVTFFTHDAAHHILTPRQTLFVCVIWQSVLHIPYSYIPAASLSLDKKI